jgi:aryl-alcohol dehydrogenase-like predicted oxidoreductase
LTEQFVQAAYKACLENGITFIDTAEIYGKGTSERILGNLLRATPPPLREKVVFFSLVYFSLVSSDHPLAS